MDKLKLLWVAGLLALLLVGTGSQRTQAQSSLLVWSAVSNQGITQSNYNSVYMLNSNTAWLAGKVEGQGGASGLAQRIRLINGRWQADGTWGFIAPLNSIVAVSADNVWAVGDNNTIVHWDGSNWQSVASPVAGAQLYTIQMFGNGEEGWIGGGLQADNEPQPRPVLLHYQSGKWQEDKSISGDGAITSLHFAAGSGWAVGHEIWRYSNGTWTQEQVPPQETGIYASFAAVRALNNDEAWAVGNYVSTCGICVSHVYGIHRTASQGWQPIIPGQHDAGIDNPYNQTHGEVYSESRLNAVTFSSDGYGVAVGSETRDGNTQTSYVVPMVISYSGGRWRYELMPADALGGLWAVSLADDSHILAVGDNGLIMSYGYGNQSDQPPTPLPNPNPLTRVTDPHDPTITYFGSTGHTLRGAFKQYWESFGGLAQFGYPLTEEFQEVSPTNGAQYTVQYFERNRFEYHPELSPPDNYPSWAYQVLLGLLGRSVTTGRESEAPFRAASPLPSPASYFVETSHNLSGGFKQYWLAHGGLAQFGYPISEEFQEVNPSDGKSYTVQYFERNRFEFHPELPDPYKVSLGLLGTQVLQQRGWLP